MIVSERKKFIFIHVPKTAGKSVEQLLLPFDDKVKSTFFRKWRRRIYNVERPINEAYFRRHDSASTVRKILGSEVYGQYLSFAFVRNPYDHAWSHYRYMKHLGTPAANRARSSSFSQFIYWRLENQGKFSQEFQKIIGSAHCRISNILFAIWMVTPSWIEYCGLNAWILIWVRFAKYWTFNSELFPE